MIMVMVTTLMVMVMMTMMMAMKITAIDDNLMVITATASQVPQTTPRESGGDQVGRPTR